MAKKSNVQTVKVSANASLEEKLAAMQAKLDEETARRIEAEKAKEAAEAAKDGGRATQVLEIIKNNPQFVTGLIADQLNIESKNVSSVLNKLKSLKHRWLKDADEFVYIGKMDDASWNEYKVSIAYKATAKVVKKA